MINFSKTIVPDWPAPSNIEAFTTTRFLKHQDELNLPSNPILLKQVHGSHVINVSKEKSKESGVVFSEGLKIQSHSPDEHFKELEGDGVFTSMPNVVCGVRTADCVPVLMCDIKGEHVAAVHAGWKGIKSGVLENAINYFPVSKNALLIWLGPCISQKNYEVRDDMKNQFGSEDESAFITLEKGRYLCDLIALIEHRLQKIGVSKEQIFKANLCTFQNEELFDSYRRDSTRENGGKNRMMSLIWCKKSAKN